ncbi:hypothetical protein ABC733_06705 [Mangrovibacter sp. SLW1]
MKVNRILIGLVIVLLLVAIIVFANVLLNQYKGHVMEFGSVSDWLSALSTFGTLIVAYMAYKKAPEWILRKRTEDMYDAIKNLKRSIEKIRRFIYVINFFLNNYTSEDTDYAKSIKNDPNFFKELNSDLSKLFDNMSSEFTEFKLTSDNNELVKEVSDIRDLYFTLTVAVSKLSNSINVESRKDELDINSLSVFEHVTILTQIINRLTVSLNHLDENW